LCAIQEKDALSEQSSEPTCVECCDAFIISKASFYAVVSRLRCDQRIFGTPSADCQIAGKADAVKRPVEIMAMSEFRLTMVHSQSPVTNSYRIGAEECQGSEKTGRLGSRTG
jgi:hypothetical protein